MEVRPVKDPIAIGIKGIPDLKNSIDSAELRKGTLEGPQLPETPDTPEVKAALRQTEALQKVEAGLQVINMVTESIEETKKITNEKIQENKNDTSQSNKTESHPRNKEVYDLSDEFKEMLLKKAEGKALSDSWTIEILKEMWDALTAWQPSARLPVTAQLQQLQELYRALQKLVLENTDGQNLIVQMGKLDTAVADVLKLVTTSQLDQLIRFFRENGESQSAQLIQNSLFFHVTGKTVEQANLKNMTSARIGAYQQPVRQSAEDIDGLVYSPAGKGKIQVPTQYMQAARSNANFSSKGSVQLEQSQQLLRQKQCGIAFTAKDIEKTDLFIRHIESDPFIIQAELSDQADVVGFTAGLVSLKAQFFAAHSGVSQPMASAVKSAINQFVFHLLHSADIEEKGHVYAPTGKETKPPEKKELYEVYNYMAAQYQTTKDPKTTLLRSFHLILERLYKKKEKKEGKGAELPKEDQEIFYMRDKTGKLLAPLEVLRCIKKSWNQFIEMLGVKHGHSLQFQEGFHIFSLWGATMKPSMGKRSAQRKPAFFAVFLFGLLFLLAAASFVIAFTNPVELKFYFVFGGAMLLLLFYVAKKYII